VTWSPRALRALAVLLGALLIVVAYWWWQGRTRPIITLPEPVAVSAGVDDTAAASAQVIVHVRGRVVRPGVLTLPAGSRVVDAIEAAGGMKPGARVLVDGEQVAVGLRRSAASPPTDSGDSAGSGASGAQQPGGQLVDINNASAAELEALPGIGPVLASRIVQWRVDNGPFTDVEILGEVSGIGDALMAQLRPLVRVG
jgi:competence protein ComEA